MSSSSTIQWWRYTNNGVLACLPVKIETDWGLALVRPNHSGAQSLCNFLQSSAPYRCSDIQQFSEYMHVKSWDIFPTLIQNLNFIKHETKNFWQTLGLTPMSHIIHSKCLHEWKNRNQAPTTILFMERKHLISIILIFLPHFYECTLDLSA